MQHTNFVELQWNPKSRNELAKKYELSEDSIFGYEICKNLLCNWKIIQEAQKINLVTGSVISQCHYNHINNKIDELKLKPEYESYKEQIRDLEVAIYLHDNLYFLFDNDMMNKYSNYLDEIIIKAITSKKNNNYESIYDSEKLNKIDKKIIKKKKIKKILRFLSFGLIA